LSLIFNIAFFHSFPYYIGMKRLSLLFIVSLFTGMMVPCQEMSYFTQRYMEPEGTFAQRLVILETIRDEGITGIGDFYRSALRFLILRSPDIKTAAERSDAEQSVVILAKGLGAEKYTAAALELWQAVELFDVRGNVNDGNAMRESLLALGQVNGKDFIPQIVHRLNMFNSESAKNAEHRRRTQMGVMGCITALESLKDIRGFRPVFFASVGPYDQVVKELAFKALPNIAEDPADAIIDIIREPSSNPDVKLMVWNEMFRLKMPDSSKPKVAAAALEVGWNYMTSNKRFQVNLSELRKGAIGIISQFGVSNDSVYVNLEKSYSRNFTSNNFDIDEVKAVSNALSAIKSEQAVNLLYKFLKGIDDRRRTNTWGNKERICFELIVTAIGATKTQSMDVRLLLMTISRNSMYTPKERDLASAAISALTQ